MGFFGTIPEYSSRSSGHLNPDGDVPVGRGSGVGLIPALVRAQRSEVDQRDDKQAWIAAGHGHHGSAYGDGCRIQFALRPRFFVLRGQGVGSQPFAVPDGKIRETPKAGAKVR